MTDDELRAERQHLQASLDVLAMKIKGVREDISRNMRADEKEIWETNLVILQVHHSPCFWSYHRPALALFLGVYNVALQISSISLAA